MLSRIFHAQTMKQNVDAKSLKDYEKNLTWYYEKEIVPDVVKRKLFKPEDLGRLGKSATNLGIGKIRTKSSAGNYIIHFLNKTTIHGLNHIAAPRRHFIERILTVLFLAVALACLVASSLSAWYQYQINPTSMVLDFDSANFNVTKPAITVCLHNKVSTDKFPEVFEKFGVKDTQEARDFFLFISNPIYQTLNQTPIYNGTSPEKWLEILSDLYVGLEQRQCTQQTINECEDSHSPITTNVVTEKGICTMMNGVSGDYSSANYWLSENWTVLSPNTLPVYTYIYRNERISFSNIPGPYEESVAFHHPKELPQYEDSWHNHKTSGVAVVKISATEVESTDYVQKLSQKQRTCNYPEDRGLKIWPIYTRNMCLLECRYDYFKSTCGCYPYFARPLPGISICNATQLHCIGNSAILLKKRGMNVCECRGSCDITRYRIFSIESVQVDEGLFSNGDKKFLNTRAMNVDFLFPNYKLRHEVFFGFNEFLVSVGGAAGLLLGASIISFVEILYYATLKLFWYKNNIHKRGKE